MMPFNDGENMPLDRIEFLPIPRSLPVFEDELKNRTALVLFYGEILTLAMTLLFGGGFMLVDPRPSIIILVNVGFVLELTSFIFLLRGRLHLSKSMFIFSVWSMLSHASAISGGMFSPVVAGLGFVIVLSVVFFGIRGIVNSGMAVFSTLIVLYLLQVTNLLPSEGRVPDLPIVFLSLSAFMSAMMLSLVFYDRILFGEKVKALQVEVELERERDRLALAVQAAGMGFWELNLDDMHMSVGAHWSEHLGFDNTVASLPREEWMEFIHPQDRPYVLLQIEALQQGRRMFEVEFRHRFADGSYQWVMTRGQLLEEIGAEAPLVLGVHTDIHARRQMEEALRVSRQELESVLQSTPLVLWRVDAKGRFTLAKGQGLRSFDLTPDLLTGVSVDELREISPAWAEHVAGALSEEEQQGLIEMGSASFTSRSMPLYGSDMELVGAIGVAVDISAQMQVERKLSETNYELEAANTILKETQERVVQQARLAAVGQLAAGIAHDFNNALLPITLYVEMLLGDPQLPATMRERLETVLSQAQRAASLTQQILDFGRKSLMQPTCILMAPFLERFIGMLRRTLPESIHIHLLTNGEQYKVWADESRLEQMLMNLALNARDAMPLGGTLAFEMEHRHLSHTLEDFPEVTPGDWIHLEVRDSGSGIPENILPHIFEPFFTTKADGSGSGLGLAQVFGIIKQHNGYVYARSEVEKGTCFHIWLPQAKDENCFEDPEGPAEMTLGDGERIVVVEDNPVTRAALGDVLELLDYDVVLARDANAAVQYCQEDHVDLVVSDMVMPDMSGVDLFRELQSIDPSIGVVIITGYPLGDQKQELLDLGMCGFVQKPIDMGQIQAVVKEALEKKMRPRET